MVEASFSMRAWNKCVIVITVQKSECPFIEGGISLRNASFPQLFRATVRNNQIDFLLSVR